jgi:hypothetical protein
MKRRTRLSPAELYLRPPVLESKECPSPCPAVSAWPGSFACGGPQPMTGQADVAATYRLAPAALGAMTPAMTAPAPLTTMPAAPVARVLPRGWRIIK